MARTASNILEHYEWIAEAKGEKRGALENSREMLASYDEMLAAGKITEETYQTIARPLTQKIQVLEAEIASQD